MKKYLGLIVGTAILGGAGLAAAMTVPAVSNGAQTLVSGTVHEAIFGVAIAPDGTGIAVGAGGANFATQDGGKSWKAEAPLTELSLIGVADNGTTRIAVGQMGVVFVQARGGVWEKIDSGTTQRLFGVDINASGIAVAVGAFGTVLRSADSGRTWQSISPSWADYTKEGLEPHLYSARVANDGSSIVAGETGLILAAAPTGDAWRVLHIGDVEQHINDASIFGVDIRSDGTGFAVGQAGMILKTQDMGQSWSRLDVQGDETLLGVRSPAFGQVVVTTLHGVVRSRDDGASWTAVAPSELGGWFNGVAASPQANAVIVVGQAGKIARVDI